jgi:hypothetical protein
MPSVGRLQLLLLLLALPVPSLELRGCLLGNVLDEVGEFPPALVAHRDLGVLGQPEQGGESSHVIACTKKKLFSQPSEEL